jgi:hypothetical protein
VTAIGCTWFDGARAGVWYSDHVSVEDAIVEAPKNFRRCKDLRLKGVTFTGRRRNAVAMRRRRDGARHGQGRLFRDEQPNIVIRDLNLVGNYSFDGVKDVQIHHSRLLSKDAFWNSENVTVYDSFISGEYLG